MIEAMSVDTGSEYILSKNQEVFTCVSSFCLFWSWLRLTHYTTDFNLIRLSSLLFHSLTNRTQQSHTLTHTHFLNYIFAEKELPDTGTRYEEEGTEEEEDQSSAQKKNEGVQGEEKPKRRITKPNYLKDYV